MGYVCSSLRIPATAFMDFVRIMSVYIHSHARVALHLLLAAGGSFEGTHSLYSDLAIINH